MSLSGEGFGRLHISLRMLEIVEGSYRYLTRDDFITQDSELIQFGLSNLDLVKLTRGQWSGMAHGNGHMHTSVL